MDASGFVCVQVMCKYVYIQGCVVASVFSWIFENFGSISALKWLLYENQLSNAHETCSRHVWRCLWHLCMVSFTATPCISLFLWTQLTVSKKVSSKFSFELIFLLYRVCWTWPWSQKIKILSKSSTWLTIRVVFTNPKMNPLVQIKNCFYGRLSWGYGACIYPQFQVWMCIVRGVLVLPFWSPDPVFCL